MLRGAFGALFEVPLPATVPLPEPSVPNPSRLVLLYVGGYPKCHRAGLVDPDRGQMAVIGAQLIAQWAQTSITIHGGTRGVVLTHI